ncbi:hypothetical protein VNO77_37841 [Canavalia gladiata]|uniref:Uncharacterized protein n=1 Tax=Canavalia gladiata TaxID=3824 RepID=A0AAN9K968_CANGL
MSSAEESLGTLDCCEENSEQVLDSFWSPKLLELGNDRSIIADAPIGLMITDATPVRASNVTMDEARAYSGIVGSSPAKTIIYTMQAHHICRPTNLAIVIYIMQAHHISKPYVV